MATARTEDNWQCDRGVLERNRYMLKNRLATDVTFVVGDRSTFGASRIPAHQYMLISGSPVFYAQFCSGDWSEREKGEVIVPDVTPQAFTQMMRYLYFEEAEITADSVMQILYAAKKYIIPGLSKLCSNFLQEHLDADNAAVLLEQCVLFDEKSMTDKCIQIIEDESKEVVESEGFKNISQDTLGKILENLAISEVDIFKASIRWAMEKVKLQKGNGSIKTSSGDTLRQTLGKALFNIRFPLMTIQEFANVVLPTGILRQDEENMCFRYISQDNKPQNMPFCTKPRNNIDLLCQFIHLKMGQTEMEKTINQHNHTNFHIKNETSQDLAIKGIIRYYDPRQGCCFYKGLSGQFVNISALSEPIKSCKHGHSSNEFFTTFQPFVIPPNQTYTMQINFSEQIKCYKEQTLIFADSKSGKKVIVSGDVSIKEILIEK